ncbi:MAG: sodium ion-translocating decarboxylase subunit beta [Clostridia bacterium]|nr:sodium ion-translocating decarboxylase subunit beta [Clostridia bacterium]
MWESILNFLESTGIVRLFTSSEDPWMWLKTLAMYAIVCGLVYLAVVKQYEPLLLLPIAFGMLLANLPGANLIDTELFLSDGPLDIVKVVQQGSLLDFLYLGVKLGIFPALIFMGVGAMTDFTALIANPKSLLIGAAAQIGVFLAFSGAVLSGVFSPQEAAAIGIIAGADGPTAIQVTKELAPALLSSIAIAAYSYMALIPMIQPPIMRALTTKKERLIKMTALRRVSKAERLIFPILVTIVVALIVPDAVMLVGFLMFGNILNVCGVTDRLSKTAQNGLMNAITIFLGVTVGATASAENFLRIETFLIIILGFLAFAIATASGLLFAKLMCFVTGGKINPLIGAAGVSAVPMAARMAQKVGAEADPTNFLLMHAMGPNVAGIIGSAVAAGVFLSWNW